MSSSVPVGALIGWMLLLTVKHIIADFMLQNSWMAIGKDQKTGWALPLLAHCLVHLAVALALQHSWLIPGVGDGRPPIRRHRSFLLIRKYLEKNDNFAWTA